MPQARNRDVVLEYQVIGEGDPLLLVMGLGGQLTDWPQGFVDGLVACGFQVIVYDNRDSGLSTGFDSPAPSVRQLARAILLRRPIGHDYMLEDLAADGIAVLDDLGIDKADVVGMSMGGMIAQTIAIEHPQRVSSLTSIMSTTGNRKVGRAKLRTLALMARYSGVPKAESIEAEVHKFRHFSGPTFDEFSFRARALASIERSYRPDGTGRQLAAILASPDRTAALADVTAPTLVIHGGFDPLVAPSGGYATAAAVPGARLVLFPEMGHNLAPGRWSEMAAAIRTNANRAELEPNQVTHPVTSY